MFEWCVVRCGSKNGHHKDMWSEEFGLCAQNFVNHFRLIVDIVGGEGGGGERTYMIIKLGRECLLSYYIRYSYELQKL